MAISLCIYSQDIGDKFRCKCSKGQGNKSGIVSLHYCETACPVKVSPSSSSSSEPTTGTEPQAIPEPIPVESASCGCSKRKEAMNRVIPHSGDALAFLANPIAKHIINPLFKTNLGS